MLLLVIFWLGPRNARYTILQQNPNKITLLYGCGFGLKKLGLAVGTKSQIFPKIRFEGSPYHGDNKQEVKTELVCWGYHAK